MQLDDYIKVFPNILNHNFCSEIIRNKKYKYKPAQILDSNSEGYKDTKIRNCSSTTLLGKDEEIIFQSIGVVINKYIDELKCDLPANIDDSGYEILKYKKGGFYKEHTDDLKGTSRRISISLLLNEEYEGGELQFFGDYKVQGKTGTAIVFPSNFCYPHEIVPVLTGTRYSIITWVF